jgi:Uma2 family endonuclease
MDTIARSNFIPLTPEEYLHLEEKSPVKHEYIDGRVYAMAGTPDTHNVIGLNFTFLIRDHLRGSDCRVYFSDLKAYLENRNRFFYPNILVTCNPRDRETPIYKRYPKPIVEVLSKSTEAFDRGDKFLAYQSLDSLEEYVLVNCKHRRVETFRRNAEGSWVLQSYTDSEGSFKLRSIGLSGSFDDLHEDVTLEAIEIPEDVRIEYG